MGYFATIGSFLTWFPILAGLLAVFGALYVRLTPWHELRLIRAGQTAAALSFGGALLGYAVVLASVTAHALSRADLVIWSLVGLAVQILAFLVARGVYGPTLKARMEEGCVAAGAFLGSVSLAAGVLNAACMIYEAP